MNKQELWIKSMNIGARLGCHQRPDRSFFVGGYQLPVCARCTGVTIGYIVAVVMIIVGVRLNWMWVLGLCGVMGLDWGIQRVGIKESNNIRRLITGIVGGIGVLYVYFYAFRGVFRLIQQMFTK